MSMSKYFFIDDEISNFHCCGKNATTMTTAVVLTLQVQRAKSGPKNVCLANFGFFGGSDAPFHHDPPHFGANNAMIWNHHQK